MRQRLGIAESRTQRSTVRRLPVIIALKVQRVHRLNTRQRLKSTAKPSRTTQHRILAWCPTPKPRCRDETIRQLKTGERQQISMPQSQMSSFPRKMVHPPMRTRARKRAAIRLDITGIRKALIHRLEMMGIGPGKQRNELLMRSGLGSARMPGIRYPFARHRRIYRFPLIR